MEVLRKLRHTPPEHPYTPLKARGYLHLSLTTLVPPIAEEGNPNLASILPLHTHAQADKEHGATLERLGGAEQ